MNKKVQNFGKSLLMPISTLSAAGIFLGISAALQNQAIVGQAFINFEELQLVIGFIRRLAGFLFGNLPIFFCISIAAGLSKDEKPTGIYSSVLGFLAFHLTLNYILEKNGINPATTNINYLMKTEGLSQIEANLVNSKYEIILGYFTYRMNIFSGIIVGVIVSALHNRFHKIELPSAINFFGGKRFVPIITLLVLPIIAVVSYFVWPFIDNIIASVGRLIENLGVAGTFLFGFLNRLLIPTGLHHILNQLVRFTPVGGSAEINGELISGALSIFNFTLNNGLDVGLDIIRKATRYIGQGHMVVVMFGLPGACLAMIKNSKLENINKTKAMLGAAFIACFLTGITEPIEFSFMFVSPVLFLFHSIMTGLSYAITYALNMAVGGVQAGLIDFVVFGVLRGTKTLWYLVPVVGAIFFLVYYFVFDWYIKKFDVKTPGREDKETSAEEKEETDKEMSNILLGLGGKENIQNIENCFTRLRVQLKATSKIDKALLEKSSPIGIKVLDEENIQIIYGLRVEGIATKLKKLVNNN